MKWRIYRDIGTRETILWWPYNEQCPNGPYASAFGALMAVEGTMNRALWSIRNLVNRNEVEPFVAAIYPDYFQIGDMVYRWELEE